MKQYAVLGLGIFGKSVVLNLMNKKDVEVFAIDKMMSSVDEMKDIATQAIRLDTTQKEALEAIEINKFDAVIVTIGQQDMMASILTALILKEMGVERIIARYINNQHKTILALIGIKELINPEERMGEEIAKNITSPNALSYFELSEEYSIEEIKITSSLEGKSIFDIDIRDKHKINVIAVKTETYAGEGSAKTDIDVIIDPNRVLVKDDCLIVIGLAKDLEKFRKTYKA